MQPRRLRPVAALTLALLSAPFLAATTVAAQASTDTTPSVRPPVVRVSWLATTQASVRKLIDTIELATAETVVPPKQEKPVPAVRATPPAPPPPAITDPATWAWPGNGPITSAFGPRWGRMHEGVDIDAAYGSAVVAAHRGTVIVAGWGQTGYGRVVEIDHGSGLVTRYAHLSAISVSVGQVVAQRQLVGAVGASGSVTAAHLHYEIRQHGVARNPATWLPAGGASAAGNPG